MWTTPTGCSGGDDGHGRRGSMPKAAYGTSDNDMLRGEVAERRNAS